jgi:hypothetical protein
MFIKHSIAAVLAAALLFSAVGCRADSGAIEQSGSLDNEIARLKALVFPENSGLYIVPKPEQLTAFRALAASVMNGSYETAATEAQALGYELAAFYDTDTLHEYYLLRERLNTQGKQSLGWGNYVWNPAEQNDVLVEAPHPLFDPNTPELAMDVFQGLSARGYLMAGAHRSQDGSIYGIANVAGQRNSIFEIFHETWSRATTLPIQIHGFDILKHPDFPPGADVVISNGDGKMWQVHEDLNRAFKDAGLQSYVINTFTADSAENKRVNDSVPGGTFASLSAGYNVQGQYTRNTYHMPFIHCEAEHSIRVDDPEHLWKPTVDAIVKTLEKPNN